MPKVSVIIPNYNHARFLERRFETVFKQTYQDFEVIYLDDASTDDSQQIFAQYAADKRVKAIYNHVNSGSPFKQWNKGLKEATGEYIWLAESDDYADCNFLSTLVAQLDQHPNVGLAYCQSWAVDDHDQLLGSLQHYYHSYSDQDRWQKNYINHGRDECRHYLAMLNTIPNASAVLIRRIAFEQVGGADEGLRLSGDWMLWIKILLKWDVAFVAKALNYFRTHPDTVRKSSHNDITFVKEFYFILTFIKQRLDIPKEVSKHAHNLVVYRWFRLGMAQKLSLKQNLALCKIAREVDTNVWQRLFTNFVKYPVKIILRKEKTTFHFGGYIRWFLVLIAALK